MKVCQNLNISIRGLRAQYTNLAYFCHIFVLFLLRNEYKNLILQPIRLFFSSKSVVPQRFTTQRLKTNTNSGVCLRILIKNCLIMYYGSIRKSCKRRMIKADTFDCALISRTKQVTPKYLLTIYYL